MKTPKLLKDHLVRELILRQPEEPRGLTESVPVIVCSWATWNHAVDAVALALEKTYDDFSAADFVHSMTGRRVMWEDQ